MILLAEVPTLLGCLLSWLPLRYLGRRATLQFVVAPLLTAGCCLLLAYHYIARAISPILLLGVSFQGAAFGVGFSAVPIYLLEALCKPVNVKTCIMFLFEGGVRGALLPNPVTSNVLGTR